VTGERVVRIVGGELLARFVSFLIFLFVYHTDMVVYHEHLLVDLAVFVRGAVGA
jgi:hypothetical protein